MNSLVTFVKKFLAEHSISTHSVAVAWVTLCGLYLEVPEFRDLCLQVWQHLPPTYQHLLVVAAAIFAWYKRGRKEWTKEQRQQLTGGTNAVPAPNADTAAKP